MKNKIEKIKSFILTVGLSVLVLSGCSKENTDQFTMQLEEVEDEMTIMSEHEADLDEEIVENRNVKNDNSVIYVYICGAIEKPDVYEVESGSRLFELIQIAGGFSAEADTNYLNLAREVQDGEQIIVLTSKETSELKKNANVAVITEKASDLNHQDKVSGLVDINTASETELTAITGIGSSRAQAIIKYRQEHGSFNRIEDIMKVNGIKDGLFSKIKDKIIVMEG